MIRKYRNQKEIPTPNSEPGKPPFYKIRKGGLNGQSSHGDVSMVIKFACFLYVPVIFQN